MLNNKHKVTVNKITPIEENQYIIEIEGFDAEQQRNFSEIIRRDKGGFLRGKCLNPRDKLLSRSCITMIRTLVEQKIEKFGLESSGSM